MAEQDPFVTQVLALLTPLGDVRVKRMFGGHGLFLDGTMFALIPRKGGLYLKADQVNRPDFEEQGSQSHGKMPYFEAPAETMEGWHAMEPWATGSVAASLRAKSKKTKKP